ncbi:MAG: hypothetical protein ACKVQQ_09860, partial [Burkholderiales bacterium]
MKLEGLRLALRPRNSWEAFDLGVALSRHAGTRLFAAFALPYAGFALLVNLALWGHPTVALAIVWWVKPVFDRIALAVLAQSVFGATPPLKATLAGWREMFRTGLLWSLTLGRIDFARSFHLPVTQLEGQTGRARRERTRLMDKRARGAAVWLTIVIIHFAYVVVLGLEGLVHLLAPEGTEFDSGIFSIIGFGSAPESLATQVLFNAAFLAAECVLEPLYVAAGFTYYLSRRATLEGWDLEVAFKRLAERHATSAAGVSARRVAAIVALCCLGAVPVTWHGAAEAMTASARTPEKRAIEEILKREAFGEFEDQSRWKRKNPAASEPERRFDPDLAFWERMARLAGDLLRALAWIGGLALLGYLLAMLVRRLGWIRSNNRRKGAPPPEFLFGMDLRAESLPRDLPRAARSLLDAGDARGALSLLYSGGGG